MRAKREPKPKPTCPTAWSVGPYKGADGKLAPRNHCPVCGALGIRSTDNIVGYHP